MTKEEIIDWWADWYKAETKYVMPEIAKKRLGEHIEKYRPQNAMEIFESTVERHSIKDKDVMFSMNALMGELGELANVLKKREFYDDFPTYTEQVDKEVEEDIRKPFREQKVDEAGDTLFYFVQLLNKEGITLREIMTYQQKKLSQQTQENKRIFLK